MNYAIIKVEWEENARSDGSAITQIGPELEKAIKGLATYDRLVNHHWNEDEGEHQGTRIKTTVLELHYDFRPLESKAKMEITE